ncbi:MAG: hypothetical protein DRO87_11520 [Candidatus Thorarchaeota archaeon]|nr:MAG: hypothetical protein DRO87_11520 [Candidatus Thorarchaeota archaeon]RLI56759.1 MAG: hypothetical protein DRP09_05285 [Candidatus Thorarchaeota archaeon]
MLFSIFCATDIGCVVLSESAIKLKKRNERSSASRRSLRNHERLAVRLASDLTEDNRNASHPDHVYDGHLPRICVGQRVTRVEVI